MNLKKCEELFGSGRLDEAEECLKAVLKHEPDNPEILNNLGVLSFYTKHYNEAEKYLKKALQHDAAYDEAIDNLLDVLTAQKRVSDLIPFLENALDLKPNNLAWKQKLIELQTAQKPEPELVVPLSHDLVDIRRFPFPYRAGLAIANNPDMMDAETFFSIMGILNKFGSASHEDGFGLPTSSAVSLLKTDDELSLFIDESGAPGTHFNKLSTLIKSGHIDTCYGLGDKKEGKNLTQSDIEKTYKTMNNNGLHLSIFANRSDMKSEMCVSDSAHPTNAHGDDPKHGAYHLDQTTKAGACFIWQKVNNGTINIIGQSRNKFPSMHKDVFVPVVRHGDKKYKVLPIDSEELRTIASQNNLINLKTFRNGQKLWTIKRFTGGNDFPCANHLSEQLDASVLRELVFSEGYMLIDQHLGAHMEKDGTIRPNKKPYFDQKAHTALTGLAMMRDDGAIWVTTTLRLVQHLHNVSNLDWKATSQGDRVVIKINGIRYHADAPLSIPSSDQLRGVTFYTPLPEKTKVYLGNTELSVAANGPDSKGRRSVMIDLNELEWPLDD